MTHRFLQLLRLASLGVAVAVIAPAAWSQNQYDYEADEPRATRNEPGSQQQYDTQRQNYDRDYDEQNYQSSRSAAEGPRDDQYRDPSQGRRLGFRDDGRDSTFRDEQSRAERSAGRSGDEPAGLGVKLDTSNGAIEVREIAPNSPADRAGIRRGDQILAINGQRVDSPQQLTQLVRQEQPGSQVDIRIRRNGQEERLTARLESLRQALDTMERGNQWSDQGRWSPEEEFYINSPPWSDDELMQHVNELERQVEAMREQINDLRKMLDNDPSQQRFSQRQQRDSRFRD